jgi:hypothetical protein
LDKTELLESVRSARSAWDALVAEVDLFRYEQPGVSGHWTLKDVIAHITWHDRQMVNLINRHAYVGASEWWGLPTDERNALIYAQNRDRALDDVLAEARSTYAELFAVLPSLSNEDLNDESRFPDSPPVPPGEIIAQNTYEHYQHHLLDLRNWLSHST